MYSLCVHLSENIPDTHAHKIFLQLQNLISRSQTLIHKIFLF